MLSSFLVCEAAHDIHEKAAFSKWGNTGPYRAKSKKNVRNNSDQLVNNANNKLISDAKDMASIPNLTFTRVFTEEDNAIIPLNIFQGLDEEKLIITEIQAHEVPKYLPKIDPIKSVGPDEISPLLLKKCFTQ